jgi:hypothetical protein
MPRRLELSTPERASLFAFPHSEDDIIRYYTLSDPDLTIINQHRGDHNRLGFAVQMCFLRHPGFILPTQTDPPISLLAYVGLQLGITNDVWPQYARRSATRREHAVELQTLFKLSPFTRKEYQRLTRQLIGLAQQTDNGIVLAEALIEKLRQQRVIVPPIDVIERLCGEARFRGEQAMYRALTGRLSHYHKRALDNLLLIKADTSISVLSWLRQSPGPVKVRHILKHLDRFKVVESIQLPEGLEREIHQNRLLKLANEGGRMTVQHLKDFDPLRRHASLVAVLIVKGGRK